MSDTAVHSTPRMPVDPWLVGALLTLMGLGLTMVLSASTAYAERLYGSPWHFFIRQAFAMALGLGLMAAAAVTPTEIWYRWRGRLLLGTLLLLVAVLIVGREVNGATRWISLGIMNFQPAELAKLVTVIFMAGYLARHLQTVREKFTGMLRLALPFGLMAFLLLQEPDYGSTFVIMAVLTAMLLIAGAPWRYFVLTVLPMATVLVLLVVMSPYRMARVTSFLDPWADPFGKGYQLVQALIALGSGGLTGVGLGRSVQKLLYLPDAHTDFLFSIYGEEFGFVGVVLLAGLYLFILWRVFAIGRAALVRDRLFQAQLAFGVGVWFMLQALINMGVNLGLFPTKGLTLPFFSYGGSSVLIFAIAFGIVLRVDWENRHEAD
ncbi:putative lipid II flippase FtsW [Sulfurivirga sp.]|uniref:putative lipid II flippase FtsW n=1 Tax=Sulfurivirga sp. TaxID=2614236 RepID=UPI0025F237A1|nr:putative lipid II flippase FtsW [Sulfurivirga sp.]